METILVTGVAGSLARAFVKLLYNDYRIVGIDNHEWGIATLQQEYPHIELVLDDFSEWKFSQTPVDYIIHCAAYKHQPLGETNPNAFIDNNILKTRKLFAEAYKNNVELLFVSSDKAVEPISLYGFTKAIGEKLAKHYNFAIARCGNLLNSSGSVIPTWEQAIAAGETIDITDERMQRYVIEADQAAKEMWEAFLDGESLIIPNCEKVTIIDLLSQVLRKHNKTFEDVKIRYTGARPNEKLEERLTWPWEESQ